MLTKRKGFTLIEIVIVLAIAALIMVIVFLAVQGAQRSRRDTQTKNDVNRIIALAENYASSNQGKYPAGTAAIADFQNNYVRKDITTTVYTITDAPGTPTAKGTVSVVASGTCGNGATAAGTATTGGVAAGTQLETGTYCQTSGQ